MEVKPYRITIQGLLYGLALVLALVMRFVQLGSLPLSDTEAHLALQSLNLVNGTDPVLGPHPGYLLFTSLWFFLFGDSNFASRFWPALIGSLIVFVPYLFQKPLGRFPAILLAFALALDPGLTALSRQAGGGVWAITSLMLAFGSLWRGWTIPAGIAFGLALLGGPALWAGFLAVGLSFLLFRLFVRRFATVDSEAAPSPLATYFRPRLITWAAGTFLVAGTLVLNVPAGLSAAASSLPAYLQGWAVSSGISSWQVMFAILAYAPLAVVFGILQIVSTGGRSNRIDLFLAFLWLIAWVLTIVMPCRQYEYLAWALLPMWALAARSLARLWHVEPEDKVWVLGLALVVLLLMVFAWLNLLRLTTIQTPDEARLQTLSAVGSLILAVLAVILVGWGWSFRVAGRGVGIGVAIFLLVYTLGGATAATGLAAAPQAQLWRTGNPVVEADLLVATIGDLSERNTDARDSIDIQVVGVASDALQWSLRGFKNARFDTVLNILASPSLVITTEELSPALAASYTGQGFNWNQSPQWSALTFRQWMTWLVERKVGVDPQKIILWTRSDLFPGASPSPAQP